MRRPDGVTVVAVLEFVAGFFTLCIAYIALWIAVITAAVSTNAFWGVVLWGSIGFWSFIIGALMVLVGIGLLQVRHWARWGAVLLAILALPCFPIGTIAGILILWYLLREDTSARFRAGFL